ncbi:hypothetical protein ACF0H5_013154 [Mactra antiquata]
MQSDNPTVGKGTMRMFLAFVSINNWVVKNKDIKFVFLKTDKRDVFIKPAKESETDKGVVWKKRYSLYGLKDVAQHYLPRRLLPPRFHSTPTNVTYEKGSLAILYCSIDNLGTKTVTWRKHPYNVPITVGREQFVKINRFYLSANNVQWNLLIKNVQTFDAGTYECQISSTTKILRRNITLNVIENGRSFKQEIEITGTRVVEKGESIFLMCNASGMTSPPDGIDWFKDGNLLTTRQWDDTRIEKQISYSANVIVSTLTIRNTQMSDTGTYVCRTSELLTDTFQVNVLNGELYFLLSIFGVELNLFHRTREA